MNETDAKTITAKICEIIDERTDYSADDLAGRTSELLHTDLGIDSLTLLDVALSIDQEYETDFPEEELLGMETIEKATTMVVDKLKENKESAE
ncbi:MAG: acyl carrier protein [Verrucomicrobiales bacterium]|jgi:acyl carrier protein